MAFDTQSENQSSPVGAALDRPKLMMGKRSASSFKANYFKPPKTAPLDTNPPSEREPATHPLQSPNLKGPALGTVHPSPSKVTPNTPSLSLSPVGHIETSHQASRPEPSPGAHLTKESKRRESTSREGSSAHKRQRMSDHLESINKLPEEYRYYVNTGHGSPIPNHSGGNPAPKRPTEFIDLTLDSESESEPKETEPKEVEPKEAEPKQVQPKQVEPKAAEPKQAETKQAEPKQAETKQAETKQAETKQAGPKDVEPREVKPKEVEPKEVQPKQAGPTEAGPKEPATMEAEPKEIEPKETELKAQSTPQKPLPIRRSRQPDSPQVFSPPSNQPPARDQVKPSIPFPLPPKENSESRVAEAPANSQQTTTAFIDPVDTIAETQLSLSLGELAELDIPAALEEMLNEINQAAKKGGERAKSVPDVLDAAIYQQHGSLPAPRGVNIPPRASPPAQGEQGRLFVHANPAVHGMHPRPGPWLEKKAKEIKQRGGRKAWFGKAAARATQLRAQEASEGKASSKPWSHQRPVDFGRVPEAELPEDVRRNTAWAEACSRLRSPETLDEVRQHAKDESDRAAMDFYKKLSMVQR